RGRRAGPARRHRPQDPRRRQRAPGALHVRRLVDRDRPLRRGPASPRPPHVLPACATRPRHPSQEYVVSFEEPWRLLILVAPLALLIAYVIAQRARRKYAVRFTSVDLLASVAPKRPGWQRHVSAVLMIAAVCALIVGFAEPTGTRRVPRERGAV